VNMTHGTIHAYNEGCRCDECREARRDYRGNRRRDTRFPAMIAPTAQDCAWAAGFFEGEGSVMIVARPPARVLAALITDLSQVDREPLQWLRDRWSGTIPPGLRQHAGGRPFFRWRLRGPRAAKFLCDVRPVIVRPLVQRRIDLALAFQAQKTITWENRTPEYAARQRQFIAAMRALNGRGVDFLPPADLSPLEQAVMRLRL
jgi:hypothetical protein